MDQRDGPAAGANAAGVDRNCGRGFPGYTAKSYKKMIFHWIFRLKYEKIDKMIYEYIFQNWKIVF